MKRQGRTVSRPAAVAGYVGLVVLVSAGAATGLSGSNTVYSDDIVDRSVTAADLGTNSVSRVKIQDNAVSGTEVIDGSITGADVRDGSIVRQDLGLDVVSGVTKVSQFHQVAANQTGNFTVACPEEAPVVLGGGYEWGSTTGFSASTSEPWYVDGQPNGWFVGGTNGLPQAKNLYVIAICASDGSSG